MICTVCDKTLQLKKPAEIGLAAHKLAFLDSYRAAICNVAKASRLSGVPRRNHYFWLAVDPAYGAAFAAARRETVDAHAEAARRRIREIKAVRTGLRSSGAADTPVGRQPQPMPVPLVAPSAPAAAEPLTFT